MFNKLLNLSRLDEQWQYGLDHKLGQGELGNYRPWINIRTFHSRTPRYRVFCLRLNRMVHLMSHAEKTVFQLLEFNDRIRDIREQYPLEPKETLRLCEKLDINHPGYTFGGQIMTSDFLVSHWNNDGSLCYTAIQVKSTENKLTDREEEKLKIERSYWEAKGCRFEFINAKTLNQICCSNLSRLYRFRQLAFSRIHLRMLFNWYEQWSSEQNEWLKFENAGCDKVYDLLEHEFSINDLIKILIAHKYLTFPLADIDITECRLRDLIKGERYAD